MIIDYYDFSDFFSKFMLSCVFIDLEEILKIFAAILRIFASIEWKDTAVVVKVTKSTK